MEPIGLRALAGIAGAATAISFGLATHSVVGHADSAYECDGQPQNTVLLVNHTSGAITFFNATTDPTGNHLQDAITASNGSNGPTTTGSGAGDTVIACQGTYTGNIIVPAVTTSADHDNITVRSYDGPNNVVIDGTVSLQASGVTFGGPAEGFTIIGNPANGSSFIAFQVGVACTPNTATTGNPSNSNCSTSNEDEVMGDQGAPAGTPVNDQVVDNVFTNLIPQGTTGVAVTGIQLDNTINTTVQQNLFTNSVQGSLGVFNGIVAGSTNTNGTSANVNLSLLQNALVQVFNGGQSACTTALTGIAVNGYALETLVFNNLLQNLVNTNNSSCSVVGVSSNAFGSLENEQTGTLAPVNVNIDDNLIQQIGSDLKPGTAIYLAPQPPANQSMPTTGGSTVCEPPTATTCTNVPPASYTVTDNELQQIGQTHPDANHGTGYAVDVESVLGNSSYIRDNNFDNVTVGVKNGDAGAPAPQDGNLDATNNWWGCETGPGFIGTSPTTADTHGCAQLITPAGDTSYAPPQSERVEQAGDQAGHNAGNN